MDISFDNHRDSYDFSALKAPANIINNGGLINKKLLSSFEECIDTNMGTETASSTLGSSSVPTPPPSDGMKVFVRLRPVPSKGPSTVKIENEYSISITAPENSKKYTYAKNERREYSFTRVFDFHAKQENVYEHTASPLFQRLLQGESSLLLAYGMTNAGKTFTIQGNQANPGILPRLLEDLTNHLNNVNKDKLKEEMVTLSCSIFEVYQETILDLLNNEKEKKKVQVRDIYGQIDIVNLTTHNVGSLEEGKKLLKSAELKRSKSQTALNNVSSRSHAIYSFTLQTPTIDKKKGIVYNSSTFHLVDLAGNERGGRTLASYSQQKEANKINHSLMLLWKCLKVVKNKENDSNSNEVIPFRESKLTHLLMPVISRAGINGVGLITCINPQDNDYDETLPILNNASLACQIKLNNDIGKTIGNSLSDIQKMNLEREQLNSTLGSTSSSISSLISTLSNSSETSNNSKSHVRGTTNSANLRLKRTREQAAAAAAASENKSVFRSTRSAVSKNSKVIGNNSENTNNIMISKISQEKKNATQAIANSSKDIVLTNSFNDLTLKILMSDIEKKEKDISEKKREYEELEIYLQDIQNLNKTLYKNKIQSEIKIRKEITDEYDIQHQNLESIINDLIARRSKLEEENLGNVQKSCHRMKKKIKIELENELERNFIDQNNELNDMKLNYEKEISQLTSHVDSLKKEFQELSSKYPQFVNKVGNVPNLSPSTISQAK